MTHSTDFSAYFVAKWKAGQMPQASSGNVIVDYDQTSHAYRIAREDMADFLEWVAINWQTDNEPLTDEPARQYLDRIGVSISEAA